MPGIKAKPPVSPLIRHYYPSEEINGKWWVDKGPQCTPSGWESLAWSLRPWLSCPLSQQRLSPLLSTRQAPILAGAGGGSFRNVHKQFLSCLCFLETSCPPCTHPAWIVRSLRARLYPPSVPVASLGDTPSLLFSLQGLTHSSLTKDKSRFRAQQKQFTMAEGWSPLCGSMRLLAPAMTLSLPIRKESKRRGWACIQLIFSFFSFYSVPDHSPWDDPPTFKGGSSTSSSLLWDVLMDISKGMPRQRPSLSSPGSWQWKFTVISIYLEVAIMLISNNRIKSI